MSHAHSRFVALVTLGCIAPFHTSCGTQPRELENSKLQFVQGSNQQSAVLEEKDLSDDFLFGLNVIDSKNFFSNAYNLTVPPQVVSLMLSRTATTLKLNVRSQQSGSQQCNLMSFNAKQFANGRIEVDFSSPGNEVELYNGLGGELTSPEPSSPFAPHVPGLAWRTDGAPKVLKVEQTSDLILADILHKVSAAKVDLAGGTYVAKSGSVTYRLFLKRVVKPAVSQPALTVAEARAKNIGYFPGDQKLSPEFAKIGRFAVDTVSRKEGQIVVHLKDFPKEYYSIGEAAVLSWNKAFGFKAIVVKRATADITSGDPRYNVIRWMDGLDSDVRWAGYSPTMFDPTTGNVVGGQILINGSTTLKSFQAMTQYTDSVIAGFAGLHGKIGNVPVIQGAGETPVVTFISDPGIDFKTYAHGYFYGVIMHEFGHTLGLRHNFAGSTVLDADKTASSVMDYDPNWITDRRTDIGSYDMAAIRLGYFGESPRTKLAFCTDEDIPLRIDCNQADYGDPVDYTIATLMNGSAALSQIPIPLPADVKSVMSGAMHAGFKILKLISQVPASKQLATKNAVIAALEGVRKSTAAPELSAADQAIVDKNLAVLHSTFHKTVKAEMSQLALETLN